MDNKFKTMKNKKLTLTEFKIEGLFGSRDICIPFNNPVKILIGENGLGKTTMLNALYYTITSQFHKLNSIDFEKISLTLSSGDVFEISKSDIALVSDEELLNPRVTNITSRLDKILTDDEKIELARAFQNQDNKTLAQTVDKYVRKVSPQFPSYSFLIRKSIQFMFEGTLAKLQELSTKLRQNLGTDIIYFPTYRRIEEDLKTLGLNEEKILREDRGLIHFGMEDVQTILDSNLLEIKNTAINGFSSLTGELLNQYVEELPKIPKKIQKKIESNILNIILDRVGENIKQTTKDEIIRLVDSKQIFQQQEKYRYLANFLVQLIKIYEEQEELDYLLKEFSEVCSKYLIGKRLVYNESKLTISTYDNIKDKPIDLKNLSSGEKQILSIFSKIYLESRNSKIVLFDEPELSLSIEWQRDLLTDILKSNKCDLLIVVTHSPFIFDNELDILAVDMNDYVHYNE